MKTLTYDTAIEVTRIQYDAVMNHYAGCVAGRQEGDKYFIKVWLMRHADGINSLLNKLK